MALSSWKMTPMKSDPLIRALQRSLDQATEPKLREQLNRLIASLKSKRANKAA
jgi:hypothetical protein